MADTHDDIPALVQRLEALPRECAWVYDRADETCLDKGPDSTLCRRCQTRATLAALSRLTRERDERDARIRELRAEIESAADRESARVEMAHENMRLGQALATALRERDEARAKLAALTLPPPSRIL